jgi:hypothetical protein
MCNKESADSDGRKAEVVVGRSTSFLGGHGTGERRRDEDCWTESPLQGKAEDMILRTSLPSQQAPGLAGLD